jgi:hypothetical protein
MTDHLPLAPGLHATSLSYNGVGLQSAENRIRRTDTPEPRNVRWNWWWLAMFSLKRRIGRIYQLL